MNITKVSLLGVLAAATLLHAGTSWTLDACLKQAAEKSLSLETAKLREQQAQVNVKQAKKKIKKRHHFFIGKFLK